MYPATPTHAAVTLKFMSKLPHTVCRQTRAAAPIGFNYYYYYLRFVHNNYIGLHRSASDRHGHHVEDITRRMWRDTEPTCLRNGQIQLNSKYKSLECKSLEYLLEALPERQVVPARILAGAVKGLDVGLDVGLAVGWRWGSSRDLPSCSKLDWVVRGSVGWG